ncbi:MAG: dimethylsulfoniopropionate demethylase [Minwuiales bacterium]|nr:dimethylsulfoniopropionate demethylase [Minwuiales bacterium]
MATEVPTPPVIGFSPRVRKSPYFDATRRYGCTAYTVYNHMFMPTAYGDPVADYWRLAKDVAVCDVAVERQVEIAGPDAFDLVQMLTPRNLEKLRVGQCKYVLLTDENGGIVNDPVLLRLADDRFWLSLADSDVLLWAKGVAHGSGMDVRLFEPDVSPLMIQGPKAADLARDLFGDWVDDLKYFWFREVDLDGMPLLVARTGYSGERAYELYLRDGRFGDCLWERVVEAGQTYNIGPATPSQISRIEAGLLSYGADMTLNENPFELGLDRLVDLDQDVDFIGKAALRRIAADGVERRMAGVEIHGPELPAVNEEPWPVEKDGRRVGKVTSCVYSPRLEKNIGFALLETLLAEPGTELTLKASFGDAAMTVAPMPFLKSA